MSTISTASVGDFPHTYSSGSYTSGNIDIDNNCTYTTTTGATWGTPYTITAPTWGTNTWTATTILPGGAEAMVDVIDGCALLSILFSDAAATAKALEKTLRLNYKHKDEIGERVRAAAISKENAALTLPWLLAYLFAKRADHEACATYVEEVCQEKFIKNGSLTLVGSSESVWSVFASYEGDLVQLSLEFSAYCQTL